MIVTVTVNTAQMNIFEQMDPADYAGTSLAEPALFNAFREMIVPGGPTWAEEHVKRLSAKGIQSAFPEFRIGAACRLAQQFSTRRYAIEGRTQAPGR